MDLDPRGIRLVSDQLIILGVGVEILKKRARSEFYEKNDIVVHKDYMYNDCYAAKSFCLDPVLKIHLELLGTISCTPVIN